MVIELGLNWSMAGFLVGIEWCWGCTSGNSTVRYGKWMNMAHSFGDFTCTEL